MSQGTSNRDGGKTSESGHLRSIQKAVSGEVLNGLATTQRGAGANMSVDVAIGDAIIPRSDGTYGHPVFNDAVSNNIITTSDPSNPRRDILVMYVDYSVTPSTGVSNNTNGVVAFKVVAGTPAGSPVDPTDAALQSAVGASNPYIKIARIRVAAAASSITTSVIDDLRKPASGLMQGGWSGTSLETMAYASATSFTISGVDLTAKYTPGAKLRISQSGSIKYFTVTSSTFSTNTTVNIDGDGTYTLTNVPLDAVSLSYHESPAGFPSSYKDAYVLDHVESGCVWTGDAYASTRVASMTAGFIWLNGKRLRVDAVTSRTFSASLDTYVDFSDNGDGTAIPNYTTNTTNTASPALTAGRMRNAILQVGATNIASVASINQGQETKLVPIISSVPMQVTDSLGNLICCRDASPDRIIGMRRLTASQTGIATTDTQITGLSAPIIIPTNPRKVTTELEMPYLINAGGICTPRISIWDGTVVSGTLLQKKYVNTLAAAAYVGGGNASSTDTLAAGSHTINAALSCTANTIGATSVDGNWFILRVRLS